MKKYIWKYCNGGSITHNRNFKTASAKIEYFKSMEAEDYKLISITPSNYKPNFLTLRWEAYRKVQKAEEELLKDPNNKKLNQKRIELINKLYNIKDETI